MKHPHMVKSKKMAKSLHPTHHMMQSYLLRKDKYAHLGVINQWVRE